MKVLALLVALVAFTGCSSTPHKESVGQYVDNSSISMSIKSKLLADSKVSGTSIEVESYKGTVILSGFLNTESEKERAIEIAKSVKGVHEVKDSLFLKEEFSE